MHGINTFELYVRLKMKERALNHFLLFIYLSIKYVNCQQAVTIQSPLLTDDNNQCPFWHFFNPKTSVCECYNNPMIRNVVKCTEQGIAVRVGHCMTYEEEERTIYIAPCAFSGNFTKSDSGQYVEVPVQNISELNVHMCQPMNRKGRLCSECIEGFGPSVISSGIVCSDCTGAWYGIPLYLFLEFVPITVFYIVILFFRVNITSAPMVAFILYSQLIVTTFLNHGPALEFENPTAYYFVLAVVNFYGFWNLDFFRHILPPFCVSPELKQIHVVLIDYVSAFYPLCLICITWIIIKLHFHNFKPVVWLWNKLSKCFCIRDCSFSRSNSLIDVFATSFLLSYTKMIYASGIILSPLSAVEYKNDTLSNTRRFAEADAGIEYFGREHALYALISILIIPFILVPPIFLILYPIKVFRLLLFKCHLSTRTIASLNLFVEKYYSCYRDGTEGGKDMRSLASMYFILRWIGIFIYEITPLSASLALVAVMCVICGTVIALVRPYKKSYMNIIDTLIIENLALLGLMAEKYLFEDFNDSLALFYAGIFSIFSIFPLLGLSGFIAYRIFKKCTGSRLDVFNTKKHTIVNSIEAISANAQLDSQNGNQELPDRMLHPQQYALDMNNFKNVDYVRVS